MVAGFFKIVAILIALAYLVPALFYLVETIRRPYRKSAWGERAQLDQERRIKTLRESTQTRLVSFEVRRDD
jgi:hypothetical protein